MFFLRGASTTHCPCLQATTGVVDGKVRRRRGGAARHDGSLLVVGQLDGTRRRTRLVVTAALPLSDRALVRRALRLARSAELCERRTSQTERGRTSRRRQRRPDGLQSADVSARRDGRKRPKIQERVSDAAARRSRKRKPQRNRRRRD